MLDLHARYITELDCLARQGEGPGNHRLGGNHCRQGGQTDQGDQRPGGSQQVEGVARRLRVLQQHGTLAEVVQYQRRQYQGEPGPGNRLAPEVAHVGIQRLGTGQGQDHSTENGHAHARVNNEEAHRPDRIERLEHLRALGNAVHAQRRQDYKPGNHHRPEQNADPCGAMLLDQKQRHQHHQGYWHHPVIDTVEGQLHALHRRQHRNGRGDHAVTIKQRSTDQATAHHQRTQFGIRRRGPAGQRGQGHDAALALVVGAQDEQHVLDRDHPDQRPEDQRQDTQHAVMVDRHPIVAGKHLLEGIQGAGADIAVHHPYRRHQQAQRLRRRMPGISLIACLNHPLLPQPRPLGPEKYTPDAETLATTPLTPTGPDRNTGI
ncbi:hypothetical protein D3C77_281680 [compost metagenome]